MPIPVRDLPGGLGNEIRFIFSRFKELRDRIDELLRDYSPADLPTMEDLIEEVHRAKRLGTNVDRIAEDQDLSRYSIYRILKKKCKEESCFCRRADMGSAGRP